ncbi:hypothetical protein [Parvularcula oceani]|uniref:hypothetical protein n=1 Tax=Parvularcula oceani TaxID=1247963 RepID=UPI0004E23568|nr:hypothetical protein [Parvularcula oceani]
MAYYVVKIRLRDPDYLMPPIVVNVGTEDEAYELTKYYHPSSADEVKIAAVRPDVAEAAYGAIPLGKGMIANDWVWSEAAASELGGVKILEG